MTDKPNDSPLQLDAARRVRAIDPAARQLLIDAAERFMARLAAAEAVCELVRYVDTTDGIDAAMAEWEATL